MLTGIWTKDFHQKYKTGRVGLKSACRVRLLLAHQASGNDDDYGSPTAKLWAASSRPMQRRYDRRGCGTLIFPHHEGRTPTHGYAASREAAMTAFAKSWRRE